MDMDDATLDADTASGGELPRAIRLGIDLPDDLTRLWERYSHLWRERRRPEAYELLPELLNRLDECDAETRRRFARECCRIAFSTDTVFPMTHRLLVEVMLPYLAEAIDHSRMPDILWVVEAKRQLYTKFVDKVIGRVSDFQLLKKALELEPNHPRAARLLLEDLMYILDFESQSMPDGYLCPDEKIERTLQLLAQALDISAAGATPEERIFFLKHKRLFEAWRKYSAVSPNLNFGNWCEDMGVSLP